MTSRDPVASDRVLSDTHVVVVVVVVAAAATAAATAAAFIFCPRGFRAGSQYRWRDLHSSLP